MVRAVVLSWMVLTVPSAAWAGGLFHHKEEASCDPCGGTPANVTDAIARLQGCPNGRARARAVVFLRRADWKANPEIVGVLVTALMVDPDKRVRMEAAQTLARLGPCQPDVHMALQRAACDPDFCTRYWGKKGLKLFRKKCPEDCPVCGTVPAGAVVAAPAAKAPTAAAVPSAVVVPAPPAAATLQPLEGVVFPANPPGAPVDNIVPTNPPVALTPPAATEPLPAPMESAPAPESARSPFSTQPARPSADFLGRTNQPPPPPTPITPAPAPAPANPAPPLTGPSQ